MESRRKLWMESSRSDAWHQSEGRYMLRMMPYACGDDILAHARLHTNPSDWIEKSKSFDLLFSMFANSIGILSIVI